VSGAIATSSWSWTPFEPFGFVSPITSKLVPLMRTDWPTGSEPANRLATTVGPSTTSRRCFLTSAEVNIEPVAIW
jgi:hypothetical protein